MKIIRYSIFVPLILGGCAPIDHFTDHRFTPRSVNVSQDMACYILEQASPAPEQANLAQAKKPDGCILNPDGTYPKAIHPTDVQVDIAFLDLKAALRDKVRKIYTYELINQSDKNCDQYLRRLKGRDSILTYTLGVMGLAFAAAGAVTTPVSNAHILSGLGGLANSSNSEVETAVLDSQHFDIITNANIKGREAAKAHLLDDINGEIYKDAPLSAVRQAIATYNTKCGIMFGIEELAEKLNESPTGPPQNSTENAVENGVGP